MRSIAPHEIADLRQLADDGIAAGKWIEGAQLHGLLDSYEGVRVALTETDATSVEDLIADYGKADDLQEKVDEITGALDCAANDLEREAENFDDLQIEIGAEIDRLQEVARELALANFPGSAGKALDSATQLKGVVESLRRRRDALNEAARRARAEL